MIVLWIGDEFHKIEICTLITNCLETGKALDALFEITNCRLIVACCPGPALISESLTTAPMVNPR